MSGPPASLSFKPCHPSNGCHAGRSQHAGLQSTCASAIKADCVAILGITGWESSVIIDQVLPKLLFAIKIIIRAIHGDKKTDMSHFWPAYEWQQSRRSPPDNHLQALSISSCQKSGKLISAPSAPSANGRAAGIFGTSDPKLAWRNFIAAVPLGPHLGTPWAGHSTRLAGLALSLADSSLPVSARGLAPEKREPVFQCCALTAINLSEGPVFCSVSR